MSVPLPRSHQSWLSSLKRFGIRKCLMFTKLPISFKVKKQVYIQFNIWNHTIKKTLQPKCCSLSLGILSTVSLIKVMTGAEWFLMEVTQKGPRHPCSGIHALLRKSTAHLVLGSLKMPSTPDLPASDRLRQTPRVFIHNIQTKQHNCSCV